LEPEHPWYKETEISLLHANSASTSIPASKLALKASKSAGKSIDSEHLEAAAAAPTQKSVKKSARAEVSRDPARWLVQSFLSDTQLFAEIESLTDLAPIIEAIRHCKRTHLLSAAKKYDAKKSDTKKSDAQKSDTQESDIGAFIDSEFDMNEWIEALKARDLSEEEEQNLCALLASRIVESMWLRACLVCFSHLFQNLSYVSRDYDHRIHFFYQHSTVVDLKLEDRNSCRQQTFALNFLRFLRSISIVCCSLFGNFQFKFCHF
jgi:hypothetical protein